MLPAAAVIAVHAAALGAFLAGWYGYGWEADLGVAGRIGLCIVWLALAAPLGRAFPVRTVVVAAICELLVRSSG